MYYAMKKPGDPSARCRCVAARGERLDAVVYLGGAHRHCTSTVSVVFVTPTSERCGEDGHARVIPSRPSLSHFSGPDPWQTTVTVTSVTPPGSCLVSVFTTSGFVEQGEQFKNGAFRGHLPLYFASMIKVE